MRCGFIPVWNGNFWKLLETFKNFHFLMDKGSDGAYAEGAKENLLKKAAGLIRKVAERTEEDVFVKLYFH